MAADASTGVQAFANLLKCMVGSGILTLPYVTAKVGLGISLPGLAIIAYLTQEAIRFVVRCAAQERSHSQYVDLDKSGSDGGADGMHGSLSWNLVSKAAFGRAGLAFTLICLVGAQLGVVASYLNFVGNTFMLYMPGLTVLQSRVGLWVVVTLLCLLRPLKSVAFVSGLALAVYAVIFVLIGYYGATAAPRSADSPALNLFSPAYFGAWFGPAIFAFEGAGPALSIYESMGTTDVRPFFRVLTSTYSIAVLLYGFVAAAGYISWGERCVRCRRAAALRIPFASARRISCTFHLFDSARGPSSAAEFHLRHARSVTSVVIDSFPPTFLGSGSRCILAIILAMTYPIQVAPVFQLVESTMTLRRPALRAMWPVTRALVVGFTAFASFLIPDMEKMVALTGGVMFSFIGFILPGAFFLKLRPPPATPGQHAPPGQATACEVATAIALVALGTVGGVFSVYSELFASR